MALKTSLVISGDTAGAVSALDKMDHALDASSKEVQDYEQAFQQADAAIGRLAQAQAEATREIAQAKAAYKANEIGLEEYSRSILETKSALSLIQGEYRGAMKGLSSASHDLEEARKAANDNLGEVATGAKLAGHHILNLSYQFQDLGVQIASGGNPMTAFIQQGSQIAGVLAQAGVGVGGMIRQLAGMAGAFLLANPLILGAVAAAGVLAVTVGLVTGEINKNAKIHVTWKDTVLGAWDVARAYVENRLTAAFAYFGTTSGHVWAKVVEYTKDAINLIIGLVVVVPRVIAATFDKIPAAFGDAFYSAANLAIKAVNWLVEKAGAGVNLLVDAFNAVFGTKIGKVALGGLQEIENPYKGAMATLGKAGAQAAVSAFQTDYVGGLAKAISAAAQKRALARQDADDKKGKGGADDNSMQKAIDEALRFATALEKETSHIGKTAIEIKRLDVAAAAAAAPTKELADRIRQAGAAWEAATRGQADKNFKANVLDPLDNELKLVGLTGAARERAALALEEEKFKADGLAKGLTDVNAAWEDYRKKKLAIIDAGDLLEKEKKAASDFAAAMKELQSIANSTNLGSVFGSVGEGIDAMAASVDKLTAAEAAHKAAVENAGGDSSKIAEADALHTKAKLNATIGLISASKKLFAEQSAGYKVMEAAEKAASAVSMVRTGIEVAHGAAKIFGQSGILGFGLVAAMMAVMAGLGFKGGGGSASIKPPSAEELQKSAGTGTVLGDPSAKSDSIARSLDLMAANSNKSLEYSNSMLQALRTINTSIIATSTAVARQISVSGSMFDTSGLRLGQTGSSGVLGMFASSTTRSLYDLGMSLLPATVGQIISDGIAGQTYQVVEQVKKKSGFLGIGGGTKTTYETTYGQIDPSITKSIQDVIINLRDGLVGASKVLGVDGADAMLASFRVEIGKLSFKDMTGDQIEKQLNAIFSKVGDDMAGAILPSLTAIQKIGEGLFETTMRAVREYQVVDTSLKSIGETFGAVGLGSIALRDRLVQLFGSLDEFVSQTDFFRQNFLTAAQQIAPVQQAVTDELGRLGLSAVDSLDAFAAVVRGLDLTTSAGQDTYAALMALAPAFKQVEDYQAKQEQASADLAKKRASMEIALLNAQGNAAAATALQRQQELAALDESLRPLQEEIYLAQDVAAARTTLADAYKREHDALQQTIDKFSAFSDSLRQFRDGLLIGDATAAGGYARTLAQLRSTGSMAALGNEASLSALPDVARNFLDASKASAGSAVQYQRDLAKVVGYVNGAIAGSDGMVTAAQRQQDALDKQVDGLISVNESVVSVEQAVADLRALMDAQGSDSAAEAKAANEAAARFQVDLVAEVKRLREDSTAQNLRLLELTASLDKRALRQEIDGVPVRGPMPGDPVQVHSV